MDPWLEDPAIWSGFHNSFADEIQRTLNRDLPEPYYADLDARSEIGIAEEPQTHVIIPDVSVRRAEENGGGKSASRGGVAVAEPRGTVSESVEIVVEVEPVDHFSVRVRDRRTHEVVTLIEILSPSNKRPGKDRDKFLQKRQEVLGSTTSLVEIDLLRSGTRLWTDPEIERRLGTFDPRPDYLILLSRSWQRDADFRLQAFRIALDQHLPVIPVPLHEGEPELPLDLQYTLQIVYDAGPYRRGILNYSQPPKPPLSEEWRVWAAERVQTWRAR
jgi:hypothetical protein